MAFQLYDTANVINNGVKCLIYGGPGVGKTRLIATAPAPIILSAERGLLSLRGFHIPFFEIFTLADFRQAYQWITQSQEARQFQTIALDSISEIIEHLLAEEKLKTKDPRKAYGEIMTQGVQMIRDFRDLPNRNVVLIAKQEFGKDEGTGQMFFQPSFPGQKLGPALPYYPDEVFQYLIFTNPQTKQRTPALRCWPDQQNVAKDRSGSLSEFEPPDLSYIFNKILQR